MRSWPNSFAHNQQWESAMSERLITQQLSAPRRGGDVTRPLAISVDIGINKTH